jgi:hypothetical protein
MTAGHEKAKSRKPQQNKNLEVLDTAQKPEQKVGGLWKENLGKYLIDISKYIVTGVIIASIFKDLDDKFMIYILSAFVALIALIVGLVLTNKKK